MFNTYEFTFAGESSLMYGMVVCDIDGQGQEEVSLWQCRRNHRDPYNQPDPARPLWCKLSYGTIGVYFDFRVREDAGPVRIGGDLPYG